MTVIAFDGRSVAADTQGVVGGYGRSPFMAPKIEKVGDFVFGSTGRMGPMRQAWIKWWRGGADPESIPPYGGSADDAGNFIIFEAGRCFVYSALVPYAAEERAPFAYGSGADYAIGAMLAGANAREAVEIAIKCDITCGGEITVFDMSPRPARLDKKVLNGKGKWFKAPLKAANLDCAG